MRYVMLAIVFAGSILVSCSGKEEEVVSDDNLMVSMISGSDGSKEVFQYDYRGRVVRWECLSGEEDNVDYKVTYAYPSEDEVVIESTSDMASIHLDDFKETLHLVDGRAAYCEGVFRSSLNLDGRSSFEKVYRVDFRYDADNHLVDIKHTEQYSENGTVIDIYYNTPWIWENHFVWEDGNLIRYDDYLGTTKVYYSTVYSYSDIVATPCVKLPLVTYGHHLPLQTAGLFGVNSRNFVSHMNKVSRHPNEVTVSIDYGGVSLENCRIKDFSTKVNYSDGRPARDISYSVDYTGS